MKRLLAYLFVVLGLGLTFNVSANAKIVFCEVRFITYEGEIRKTADVFDELDISDVFQKKNVFALTVNGDSMKDACIADGDMVLMEPVIEKSSLRNGMIVSAMVPGLGTTLKYFFRKNNQIILEAANPDYEPIKIDQNLVSIQGKLIAVWRKVEKF